MEIDVCKYASWKFNNASFVDLTGKVVNLVLGWVCFSFFCLYLCLFFNPCGIWLQEFAGEDMTDLFLEEREMAIRQAQDEKRKMQMSVPGILGPHEIPEEMQDWMLEKVMWRYKSVNFITDEIGGEQLCSGTLALCHILYPITYRTC